MDNKLSKQRISILLDSDIYKQQVKKLTNEITRKAKNVKNEAELSSVFENELYYFIKSFFSTEIEFSKEVNGKMLAHKFKGRMDALCNNLVIEYKHRSKLQTKGDQLDATNQVINYLEQLYDNDKDEYRAILIDGIKIKYFHYNENTIKSSNFSYINERDIDSIIKALLAAKDKKFSPLNIVEDFKINHIDSKTKALSKALFESLMIYDDNVEILFKEWQALFHLSEHDNGKSGDITKRRQALSEIFDIEIRDNILEFKALFALQTTYAIIIKLIAIKTISKWTYDKEIMYFEDLPMITSQKLHLFLKFMEDGYSFSGIGIMNLIEGDFFSWYTIDTKWNDIIGNNIKEIIKIIDGYTHMTFKNEYEPIDIFKDLYMEIMPNAVRHSLGEYFTPAWIADYVIDESIKIIGKEDWKAIDPCCGSGIFIITLIKKIINKYKLSEMTNEDKNILINEIIDRVKGIDLNPISVLTARISYFLAISPLINNNKDIVIPVFFGDSAMLTNEIDLQGISCYINTSRTISGVITAILPKRFVDNGSFSSKMKKMSKLIKVLTKEEWITELIKEISDRDINDEVLNSIYNLANSLYELEGDYARSIWLRLITNKMMVASIKKLDIVVGNPPWVKWENLPQQYAASIKEQCIDRHIFSGQTYMGAISLNICALISNVSASRYLEEKGVLSFLMPKTLLTQDSYAGFRNFYIDYDSNERLYLYKIDDWSKSGDPFIYTNEKFVTYYYTYKHQDYINNGIPINNIKKKRGYKIEDINRYHNFDEVSKYYNFTNGSAYQLDRNRTGLTLFDGNQQEINSFKDIVGYCHYKARSGVEFTPYEIFTLEAMDEPQEQGYHKFKNFSSSSTIHKVIDNYKFGKLLETKYIKPLVKGPNIDQFQVNFDNCYGIFPYKEDNTSSISYIELEEESPLLMEYLINHKETIANQSERSKMIAKGKEFYSLSKIGKYTFAPNIVAFRDNSKMASAVITPIETKWGEKVMPICPKHAPYISMDKEGNYITEDEAYYICAILNTKTVSDYFRFTYSSRSYSINLNIKIPKYNKENKLHLELSRLAKEAHKEINKVKKNELINEMTNNYIILCKETEE